MGKGSLNPLPRLLCAVCIQPRLSGCTGEMIDGAIKTWPQAFVLLVIQSFCQLVQPLACRVLLHFHSESSCLCEVILCCKRLNINALLTVILDSPQGANRWLFQS